MNADGLRKRALVLRAVRTWFADHGYLEVPTPSLVPSPAMEEHLYALAADDGWLRTSPEFSLKCVMAAGLGRIYEIGPCWRAREQGPWHGTEFLMLEWYRAGAELVNLMDEVKSLVQVAFEAVGRPAPTPWRRTTVRDLFIEHTGIDLRTASAVDLSSQDDDWDEAFFRRWITEVEPKLQGSTIVEDWPASQAALAQIRDDQPWPVAKRFEVYIDGIELANAFFELIDTQAQSQLFDAANKARLLMGETPHPVDYELIAAVGKMPRTSGIAMGLDRLVAAACGWPSIDPGRVRRTSRRLPPEPAR
ncbi:MAG: EF-P lysine aminoacylase GenX [Rhodobacterales bacterium]|nr:EF-P lysine aminoacylase GenX [Rhodobacterales bacterium]